MTLMVRSAPSWLGDPVRNTDGETVGHVIRRNKTVYSPYQRREVLAGGFAVLDLDGHEVSWSNTYMCAVHGASALGESA